VPARNRKKINFVLFKNPSIRKHMRAEIKGEVERKIFPMENNVKVLSE